MLDAIRHSSSLSNSLGIHYMNPWRFPFQMTIDFLFKSVFNYHSNSAPLLCPWKLTTWEMGKQKTRFFESHRKNRRGGKQFHSRPGNQKLPLAAKPPASFPHSSTHSLGRGKTHRLFSYDGEVHPFMTRSLFPRCCHNTEKKLILFLIGSGHATIYRNSSVLLSTSWHKACVFIIPNKKYNVCSSPWGQKERVVRFSQIEFPRRLFFF